MLTFSETDWTAYRKLRAWFEQIDAPKTIASSMFRASIYRPIMNPAEFKSYGRFRVENNILLLLQ